jgi:hypothetical protein
MPVPNAEPVLEENPDPEPGPFGTKLTMVRWRNTSRSIHGRDAFGFFTGPAVLTILGKH